MASIYELLLLLLFCHLMLFLLGAGYEGKCPSSFHCGYLANISFPFTTTQRQDCGFMPIQNCDAPHKAKMIQLQKNGNWYLVVSVAQSPPPTTVTTLQFRDSKLYDLLQTRSCETFRNNYTLPHTFHFAAFHFNYNETLFRCNRTLHVSPPSNMHNYTKCPDYDLYYTPIIDDDDASPSSLTACTKLQLPTKDVPDSIDPFTFVSADMSVEVKLTDECANCHYYKGGQCQLDSREQFYCANSQVKATKKMPIVATATLVVAGIVAVLVFLACYFRAKICFAYLLFWRKNPTHRIIEDFLKEHEPLPTVRYSYSEVKKMTNSFTNKLGQGGYGCVFKGKLSDGRVVALKMLSKSKGDGEDFINEVASISKTSHVNIVRLLGFCLDGSQRALIYEFMPNGSLEKFIYEEKNPLQIARQLDCNTLYDIAIGVAHGLEYLHRGCNTGILHFDIKPHNILLDEDFTPKISDFGLAKICPKKESTISICDARGTVGYIATEVFSRNFGSISHKSDVYNYGMMVLEMVGSRKNIKDKVDHSSEIYFPHWIYNRLQSNQKLGLQSIRSESDDKKVRKMTIIGLWCIQTNPSTQPAISKVVEMLGGRVELLQMPPKPFLASPSTSPVHLSCSCETL